MTARARFLRLYLILVCLAPGARFARSQAASPIVLPEAIFSKPYKVQLAFQVNGVYPFTFSIVGGAKPACLSLSTEGVLSGLPRTSCRGTYGFTVAATDHSGSQAEQKYVLQVSDGKTTISLSSGNTPQPAQPAGVSQPATHAPVQIPASQQIASISNPALVSAPDPPAPAKPSPADKTKLVSASTTATAAPASPAEDANTASTDSAPCQGSATDSQPVPKLEGADINASAITGSIVDATKGGWVQLCIDGSPQPGSKSDSYIAFGKPVAVDPKTGKFSVQNGDDAINAAHLSAGKKIVAQWVSAAVVDDPLVYGKVSDAIIAGLCSDEAVSNGTFKDSPQFGAPTIEPGSSQTLSVKPGSNDASKKGSIRLCVNGVQSGAPVALNQGVAQFSSLNLKPGDVLAAQIMSTGTNPSYGFLSDELAVGTCSSAESGETGDYANRPILVDVASPGGQLVDGTVPLSVARVRVCVNDREAAMAAVDQGKFRVSLSSPLSNGDKITVQGVIPKNDGTANVYGFPSDPRTTGHPFSSSYYTFIGGAEQGGYSSGDLDANAFISAYFRSGYFPSTANSPWALWGHVRLLSAPQQSAPNIVANIANPSGTITQSSLASVGAVVDYSIGPEWRIHAWDGKKSTERFSLVAGVGETTPLASASPTFFKTPDPNTADCKNLIAQNPSLVPGNGLATPSCLENPYSNAAYGTVAFTQQKRTSFLLKYGAGVRFARVFPGQGQKPPYDGMLDLLVGQDQSITGGSSQGLVFKLEGQYPVPLGNQSLIYLFGSTSVRLQPNQMMPTINLAPAPSAPTLPDPSVVVLSTAQPNRDFYRFGIGLNLMDVLSIFKPPTTTQTGSNSN